MTSPLERGYSLIELLISTVLLTMALGATYTMLTLAEESVAARAAEARQRQALRTALDFVAGDLHGAGYDLRNVPEALIVAESNRLVFAGDIDDGSPLAPCASAIENAMNGGAERVTYRLVQDVLVRSVDCWNGGSWSSAHADQPVARDLIGTNPIFRYYDEDGNELPAASGLGAANRALVRAISVTLEAQDPGRYFSSGSRYVESQLETRIKLRNLGGP
jgi:prepilin-type N-terminal cleavage/methylation domain-containing protein